MINTNNMFKAMFKEGKKIKAQGFQGYWEYDKTKDDIAMHCKDGSIVYLRETKNMWFTISNILYKHWEEATVDNCPVLAKELTITTEAKDTIYAFLNGSKVMDIKHDLIYEFKDSIVNVYTIAWVGGLQEEVLVTKLDDNTRIIQSIKDYWQDFIIKEGN